MPLTPAAPRKHIHTRQIECRGYLREDGLWDIEGHITDVKTYPFHNEWRGDMQPGMPIHDMWIRVTVNDELIVQAVEAVLDATPYSICANVAPNFQRLIGAQIKGGWRRAVKERLGGAEGCTHLVELLSPLATVAFQTIRPYQRYLVKKQLEPDADDPTTRRPWQIDTCYGWAADHAVVQRYLPDHYTGPGSTSTQPRNGTGSRSKGGSESGTAES